MRQPLFFAALYLLGGAFLVGFGPRRERLLCAALAFPLGIALTVFLALALISLGFAVTPLRFGLAWLALLAGFSYAGFRRGAVIDRGTLLVAAIWIVAIGVVAWWMSDRQHAAFPRFVIAISNKIAQRDLELELEWRRITRVGPIVLFLHAVARMFGVLSLSALGPLLVGSLLALLGVAVWNASTRAGASVWWRVVLVVAVLLPQTLALSYARSALALHLLGFVASWMAAEAERDGDAIRPAMVCMGGVALHGYETAFQALAILGVAVFASRVPRRAWAWPLALFSIGLVHWLSVPAGEYRYWGLEKEGMAAIAAFFAIWLAAGARPLARFRPYVAAAFALGGISWIVGQWWIAPAYTPRLLFAVGLPIVLLAVGSIAARRVGRPAVAAPAAPEPAGAFAPFGGHRRAAGLLFVAVVCFVLVTNLRVLARHHRTDAFFHQMFAHDGFHREAASAPR
jgi:hypothetical protein